ncbi:hypothetical protein [Streptomyces pseudovenezuelae]|uniref:Serine/threonine protein kinase n=1 Tax=Streptomyces pseudovenezuelae TaxID=67350 RepID=A0ABT6LX20_9ACTN|nr:hypothetical protein [Streptomyces pseudovenezuelae]MDH6220271.1 hypothetical protein [Streptomyces pseudovenezuelae]
MSADNGTPNPPAGPPPSPYLGPPTVPPQGPPPSHPPRWAWWVVGIVIPVVGIVITIMVGRPGSSDDDGGKNVQSEPSASVQSNGAGQGGGKTQSSTPPAADAEKWQKLSGPVRVTAEESISGTYVELDTPKPLVLKGGGDGADLYFGSSNGDPSISVPVSADNLAPLPDAGTAPTAEACLESVDRNGSYTASPVKRGEQYCLLTGEGRIAYLKVVTMPDGGVGGGILDVTVWQTPGA